jgi:hypothetical protein
MEITTTLLHDEQQLSPSGPLQSGRRTNFLMAAILMFGADGSCRLHFLG